ncbi:hypothetical protein NH14_031190 [Paraburkholderia sacchari]|uniref:Uncharacterized protein n=2 Tax=Paraburkholderia sacchari TaxID=159450 RepID=A0A8T6ZLR6_9BURK|nr:hypothetical protein [Paraburkholderia sacchari]
MPETAAWVDMLRDAFGSETIHDAIRRGAGEPTFFAIERGQEIGTRSDSGEPWRLEGFEDRHFCRSCDGSCVGNLTACGIRR